MARLACGGSQPRVCTRSQECRCRQPVQPVQHLPPSGAGVCAVCHAWMPFSRSCSPATHVLFQEEYGPLYGKHGTGLTTWSPLCSGILTGAYCSGTAFCLLCGKCTCAPMLGMYGMQCHVQYVCLMVRCLFHGMASVWVRCQAQARADLQAGLGIVC